MPSLKKVKILPHSAKEIYDLVIDIEKYPEFLPWCRQAKINQIISNEVLEADLLIKFKSFFEKYTSNVTHGKENDQYFVKVKATKGPFKKLINDWQLTDLEDGKCEVKFFIDFEFNSIILQKLIGSIFKKATEKMMNAFEERAKKIY